MIQIFHNPRCSKSRLGLQYLKDKGVEPAVVEYLKTPPTAEQLKQILKKLGKTPLDIIRKNEDIFKTEFKGKELSDDAWVDVMVKHPKLIERPIIINGDKAVIARPTEAIDEVL